ncbi:uncharacterized protein G2W53_023935 [Senna tora]|uniref:Uncharacterized protein n=1 Tax=Senna tora TaxID=362788 RepID=A0A834WCN1_9FABA|nr:uncharacterized protein G2W53_023935 [Senna tora]
MEPSTTTNGDSFIMSLHATWVRRAVQSN